MIEDNYKPFSNALKEKMPFGFFYHVKSREIKPRGLEISSGDYTFLTNLSIWQNNKDFLRLLINKKGDNLIEEFEVQLFYYFKKIQNISKEVQDEELSRWYHKTEILLKMSPSILEDFDNKYAIYVFDKWMNSKRNSSELLQNENNKLELNNSNEDLKIDDTESQEKELEKIEPKGELDKIELDFIKSTIENYLKPFDEIIQAPSYKCLSNSLLTYFTKGIFPKNINEIKVGKVNIKALGWALNCIYKKLKTNKEILTYEYLRFGKDNISIFKDVELNEANMIKCNLYNYYTTKTSMK